MGHTGAPTCIRAGPSAWLWNLPPTLMGLRTRVGGWKELCSGGLKKRRGRGPAGLRSMNLAPAVLRELEKLLAAGGNLGEDTP